MESFSPQDRFRFPDEEAIRRTDDADLSLRSPRRPSVRSAMLLEVLDAYKLTVHLKTQNIYTDSRQNDVVRIARFDHEWV